MSRRRGAGAGGVGVRSLEAARAVGLDAPGGVAEQVREHVGALEVVDEARVLRLALLQQLVLVENRLGRNVVPVEQRVDRGRVREAEPGAADTVVSLS